MSNEVLSRCANIHCHNRTSNALFKLVRLGSVMMYMCFDCAEETIKTCEAIAVGKASPNITVVQCLQGK